MYSFHCMVANSAEFRLLKLFKNLILTSLRRTETNIVCHNIHKLRLWEIRNSVWITETQQQLPKLSYRI